MKKVLSLGTALLLVLLLACPVFAENFVPSITYKGEPEIVNLDVSLSDCLHITPISEVETEPLLPEAAREKMLFVYEQLTNGMMKLPFERIEGIDPEKMVVRDLIDLSWLCEEHPMMMQESWELNLTFRLGVTARTNVVVMVYIDGEWIPVMTVNNGDGTVSCTFVDQIGPVVFCVPEGDDSTPPTGDSASPLLWVALMLAAAAALVVLLLHSRRRYKRK